jgi:uncharacterized membrane protein HdeD (DUF308 family)
MVRPLGDPVDAARGKHRLFLTIGAVSIVLGVLAIVLPFVASLVTTVVIGWLIVIAGVFEAYHAQKTRGWAGSGPEILSAVVQVVVGLALVLFPRAGKLGLLLIVAAYFAAEGVLKLIRAMQLRRMRGSGWLVFDGLLSLALAILILAGGVTTVVKVLGLLIGITLVTGGVSMLLIGLAVGAVLRVRS